MGTQGKGTSGISHWGSYWSLKVVRLIAEMVDWDTHTQTCIPTQSSIMLTLSTDLFIFGVGKQFAWGITLAIACTVMNVRGVRLICICTLIFLQPYHLLCPSCHRYLHSQLAHLGTSFCLRSATREFACWIPSWPTSARPVGKGCSGAGSLARLVLVW